jgi:hypothetical protein
MIVYLCAPVICLLYSFVYAPWAGAAALVVTLFAQFAVSVVSHPITVEPPARKKERDVLARDVAAILLITATLGCMLSSLLTR